MLRLLVISLGIWLCAPRQSAQACSAQTGTPWVVWVAPSPGDVDVPTNTELHIHWNDPCAVNDSDAPPAVRGIRVAPADVTHDSSHEVPFLMGAGEGEAWPVAVSSLNLEPSTEYVVWLSATWLPYELASVECDLAPEDTWQEVSRFTTGAEPDTTAPPNPVITGHYMHCSACEDSACCGPYTSLSSSLGIDAPESSSFDLLYEGEVVVVRAVGRAVGYASFSGGEPWLTWRNHDWDRGIGTYEVISYDVAGNSARSAPFELDGTARCATPDAGIDAGTTDAGIDGATDAAPADAGADAGEDVPTSGGCSTTRAGSSFAILLFGLLAFRRRV